MLKIAIVSSRLVEGQDKEKKYVAYMMQVRQGSTANDPEPINVERRYTHFAALYAGLKKELPALLTTISFPKKVVMGNFDPELISTRTTAFRALLHLICNDSRLRDSPCTINFFQEVELLEAKKLINEKKYDQALSILENSLKLLNKVYTDKSRVVLIRLCRVVACGVGGVDSGSPCALAGPVEQWAALALRRYQSVSDTDLLQLYIPLVHTCIQIWDALGKDKTALSTELDTLWKRGMNVESNISLMEAVERFESTTTTLQKQQNIQTDNTEKPWWRQFVNLNFDLPPPSSTSVEYRCKA